MKINEYNQMMSYLTRPGKVLGNNINKTNTERTGLAKGTKADTKPAPKNSKMEQYINDHLIAYEDKKASPDETKSALARLEKYGIEESSVKHPNYPKKKMSKTDEYNTYFNKKSPKYYKKTAVKIPVIPPKPDLMNGHSDWNTDDWLESVDPGGWMHDDKKKAGLLEYELADEYWQEQYQIYLDNGGQLNYQQYMQQQMKNKISKEIDKRVKDKLKTEGLAAILGVPGDKI